MVFIIQKIMRKVVKDHQDYQAKVLKLQILIIIYKIKD